MSSDRERFVHALLARCTDYRDACLTLTAIHPDGKHPTPSRHIPLNEKHALHAALERLDAANALGWGAYFAVGLRRPGLSRWQRGGAADVVALSALFVDVDDASPDVLRMLEQFNPVPSCIVASGGGYHAYWWLEEPTADLETARRLLRGLAAALKGDSLSVAQSLRVPSTVNSKPQRHHALCHLIDLTERRYSLGDFAQLLPTNQLSKKIEHPRSVISAVPHIPHVDLIMQVTHELLRRGSKQRGDWLNGACPFPESHRHGDQHASFGFNMCTGYGYCFRCGSILLTDMCGLLGIDLASSRAI